MEGLAQITSELKTFPLTERLCFLFYIGGEDVESISDIVGITTSNVSTKINRLKNIMKKRFDKNN